MKNRIINLEGKCTALTKMNAELKKSCSDLTKRLHQSKIGKLIVCDICPEEFKNERWLPSVRFIV